MSLRRSTSTSATCASTRAWRRRLPASAATWRRFDAARQLAYRAAREFWGPDRLEAWEQYLLGEVRAYTRERHDPALHDQECRWIARSIGRWTWRRFFPARFRQIQAERGAKGGKASKRGADPNSITSRRPWERFGVSRPTWYRLGKPGE